MEQHSHVCERQVSRDECVELLAALATLFELQAAPTHASLADTVHAGGARVIVINDMLTLLEHRADYRRIVAALSAT
jgi:hypothetical protein